MALPNLFWQGVDQFNQRQFYECHDTLESLWLEAAEPVKTFYQAILQVSVACYHLERSNWKGAVILLGEGINKLKDYQPSYEEVAVEKLFSSSLLLLGKIQVIRSEDLPKEYGNLVGYIPSISRS